MATILSAKVLLEFNAQFMENRNVALKLWSKSLKT